VAPLLAYLRQLQRRYGTAVLLVHHARKGGHVRPGQALRGSSEFHAWGDSNLYLRRQRDRIVLTIEHRNAASGEDLDLELHAQDEAVELRVIEQPHGPKAEDPSATERVETALRQASGPIDRRALRAACRMRMTTVIEALGELSARGRIVKVAGGLELAP